MPAWLVGMQQSMHRNVLSGFGWANLCFHIHRIPFIFLDFGGREIQAYSYVLPTANWQWELRQNYFTSCNYSCFSDKMSTIVPPYAACCLLILSSSLFCGGLKADNDICQASLAWIMPLQGIHVDLRAERKRSIFALWLGGSHANIKRAWWFVVASTWASVWYAGEVTGRGFLWSKYFLISPKPEEILTGLFSPVLCLIISVLIPLSAEVPRMVSLLLSELWRINSTLHCLTTSGCVRIKWNNSFGTSRMKLAHSAYSLSTHFSHFL